jgi:predicted PurR-regulated permease PerM
MSDDHRRKIPCQGLLIFAITCTVLYVAQEVIIPLALAGLLALLLTPTIKTIRRHGASNTVAVTLVMGLLSIVMIGVIWLAASQVRHVVDDFPKYRENIKARLAALYRSDAAAFAGSVTQLTHELVDHPAQAGQSVQPHSVAATSASNPDRSPAAAQSENRLFQVSDYLSMFSSVFHPFALTAMVIILSTFMLIQRDDLRDRFLIMTGRLSSHNNSPVSTHAIDEAFATIGHYLRMQSVSNACLAVVIAIGLGLLAVPNAILWASLAFILRFIPYIGITIAAVMTCLFSFATSSDLSTPILVLAMFAFLEVLLGSIVEPVYFGQNTGLSSFAILVAALFWTWLWGIAGLFLSIPMTVCWVLIGRNFENFDFLDTILSNRTLLSPDKRLYHRMLTMEPSEFHDAIDHFSGTSSFEEIYDDILIPTLCLADSEYDLGHISRERLDAIISSIRLAADELIDGLGNGAKAPHLVIGPAQMASRHPARTVILCIPAHSELDDVMCTMVHLLLVANGAQVDLVHAPSPHGVEQLIVERGIQCICICALSTQSTMRSIAWSRILRHRFPDVDIVIGLWNAHAQGASRIAKAKIRYRIDVVTSLKQAVMLLAPACEPEIPAAKRA